jgi:hypothetical protein
METECSLRNGGQNTASPTLILLELASFSGHKTNPLRIRLSLTTSNIAITVVKRKLCAVYLCFQPTSFQQIHMDSVSLKSNELWEISYPNKQTKEQILTRTSVTRFYQYNALTFTFDEVSKCGGGRLVQSLNMFQYKSLDKSRIYQRHWTVFIVSEISVLIF